MVALPAASAETLPPLMLTMPEGDTLQTSVSVLFSGVTVAVRFAVPPTSRFSDSAESVTAVAGFASVITVSAVFAPTTSPLQGSNATVRVPLPASVKESLYVIVPSVTS